MEKEPTKRDVLQKALRQLQNKTGLTATADFEPKTYKDTPRPDARIRLIMQDLQWNFLVEIKKTVTRATLGAAVQQLRKFPEKGLLITRYITPQIAEQLKEMNIPFIDTAGNAYIYEPPLFIFIKGDKPVDDYRKNHLTRAFQPTGLQAVFALLCKPGLEDAPYREIANEAVVALGTVNWVMTDLRQRGYLIDLGRRGRRLVQKEDLLGRWVTAYPERLRPKKLLGTYMAAEFDWWKNAQLVSFGAHWGGEVAAAKLTEYLKPQVVTIYAKETPGKLLLMHRLRKEPDGNVEVLKTFWNFDYRWADLDEKHRDLVHPILIYADLLATGDERNIETAEIIYEREITRFIRED
jgi:hypothetical protein